MGFGDFAHDVGEAGVALWGSDLEGVDQCGEADRTDGDGALLRVRITGIEAVELEQEALRGAAEVVADDVDCFLYTSPSPRDATLSRMPSSA